MGVIKKGILGGFSGRVGPAVGSSWKGISVMKTLPDSVANPRTAGQVTQRGKFSQVVSDARTILTETVKPMWDRFAQKMSGYNAFVQDNIEYYDVNGMLTPANVKMSVGSLVGAENMTASYDTGLQEVTVNWDDNAGIGNALSTDKVFIVLRNETTNEIEGFQSNAIRTEVQNKRNNGKVIAPADVLNIWLSFLRSDGSIVSTSNYVTIVAP